jgi:hypothetical protein
MNKTLIATMCLGVLNGDLYATQRGPIPVKTECGNPPCSASLVHDGPADKRPIAPTASGKTCVSVPTNGIRLMRDGFHVCGDMRAPDVARCYIRPIGSYCQDGVAYVGKNSPGQRYSRRARWFARPR